MKRLPSSLSLLVGVGAAVLLLQACKKDDAGARPDLATARDLAPPDLTVVDLSIEQDMTPSPDLLPPPCTSEITSCAGLCGKVIDSCTGAVFQCGGCDGDTVCDLDTHTCITPKITCEDFTAQCGEVKNSCGKRLDCGECATGKECDRDTRTCVDCAAVTCEDLGYECGLAWLGCGSSGNPDDRVDCGTCGDGQVCNQASHICEPSCTPPATTDEINTYCAAKKTSANIECGYITDGCGGTVYCGDCEAGKKCGRRGIPNHCDADEVPIECQALGKNCGTLTSKCDVVLISCGECPDGQVCNDNGVCGPPCQPKTCVELLPADGECGNFPDDGCGAAVTCSCGSNELCGGDGKCAPILACDAYTMGEAGQPCSNDPSADFPKGDGTNLECNCDGGLLCVNAKIVVSGATAGACCQDTGAKCSGSGGLGGPCNSVNSCTDAMASCCSGNNRCDTGSNTCVNKCTFHDATGAAGKPCSTTGRSYFDGATCNCGGGLVCVGETASVAGTCCANTNATCTGTNGIGGLCSVTNSCNNAVTNCCTGNTFCNTTPDPDVCAPFNTCATHGANGDSGNPCSRGPSASFPRGDGQNLTCNCDAGFFCATGAAGDYLIVPTDGTTGFCRAQAAIDPDDSQPNCTLLGGYWTGTDCCFVTSPPTCTNDLSDCGTSKPTSCAAFGSPPVVCQACNCADYSMPNGVGEDCTVNGTNTLAPGLTCGCTGAGISCIRTASTADADGNGVCQLQNSCTSLGKATGGGGAADSGDPCNDNNVYDRNNGGGTMDFACPCGTSGGYANQQCTGDTNTQNQNGTCTCTAKTTCTSCSDGNASNGCGGTIPACCGSGQLCKNGTGTVSCCTPLACDTSWQCGTLIDPCGGNKSCGGCDTNSYCDSPNHLCLPKLTCATLQPANTGAKGSPCNEFNLYDKGNGEKFSCGCDTSGGNTNNTCVGDSASAAGTCTCVKNSCVGLSGDFPDGCGATQHCGS